MSIQNPYFPGEDEYDAYEAGMTGPSIHYAVIEAPNHVALSDFVSGAIRHGLQPCGGPVFANEMWHQAVFCSDGEFFRRWLLAQRFDR